MILLIKEILDEDFYYSDARNIYTAVFDQLIFGVSSVNVVNPTTLFKTPFGELLVEIFNYHLTSFNFTLEVKPRYATNVVIDRTVFSVSEDGFEIIG